MKIKDFVLKTEQYRITVSKNDYVCHTIKSKFYK